MPKRIRACRHFIAIFAQIMPEVVYAYGLKAAIEIEETLRWKLVDCGSTTAIRAMRRAK